MIEFYSCLAELTPGQVQWDTQQRRCREAHAHYERLRQMTRSVQEPGVGSVIETAEGVKEAGPDVPALAEATQREENARAAAMRETVSDDLKEAYLRYRSTTSDRNPLSFEEWRGRSWGGGAVTASKIWPGAPVGAVTREQAGILETGPKQVTDEMVYRAQTELVRHENPSGASAVRAALKAALQG